jgi:hypothetical protein
MSIRRASIVGGLVKSFDRMVKSTTQNFGAYLPFDCDSLSQQCLGWEIIDVSHERRTFLEVRSALSNGESSTIHIQLQMGELSKESIGGSVPMG